MALPPPTTIDATLALLRNSGYVADRPLATVLFLALRLGRPLFLEGEAGVGKTEIAKVLWRHSAGGSSGCSAMRGSTSPPPSTSGTTPAR
jgi:MoxR-like ATPase